MREISFESGGVECAAWHLAGAGDEFAGVRGRPCVVMAHGFGGTRDTGLLPYAEGFAGAGLDVLVFDYRGFGFSQGAPRQSVSVRRQRADYHAAIGAARELPGIDPRSIVLWGTSYSGGHVVAVAVRARGVAAVLSLTPALDGVAALAHMARHGGVGRVVRLVGHGVLDLLGAAVGRPHVIPVVGPVGSCAILAGDGFEEAYASLAGPTWRNEVCARTVLGVPFNRPARRAGRLPCPVLVQVGANDRIVPSAAALAAAGSLAADVREYPVDHFDVYHGPWQRRALADQLQFLRRHLAGRAIVNNESVGV